MLWSSLVHLCGTLSMALEKSSRIISIWDLSSRPLARKSIVIINWLSHDLRLWNPCCASVKIFLVSRWLDMAQWTICLRLADCLFVYLVFNGTFSTNRLSRAIAVGNISCRASRQHRHLIKQWNNTVNQENHKSSLACAFSRQSPRHGTASSGSLSSQSRGK